jgi:small subunit ribosomal protein S2
MTNIDKMKEDGRFMTLSKRERLQVDRQRAKLEKNLGSISDMSRLPAALFVVDILREHIAVEEARTLGIPVFALVDTNSNPQLVDYVIPSNDDAQKSISLVMEYISVGVKDALAQRKVEKEKAGQEKIDKASAKLGEGVKKESSPEKAAE